MSDEKPEPRSWLWRASNNAVVSLLIMASWILLALGLIGLTVGGIYAAERVSSSIISDVGRWPAVLAGVVTFFVTVACGLACTYRITLFMGQLDREPVPVKPGGKPRREPVPEHEQAKTRPSPQEIERRGMGRG